ncbi:tail fiber protein [Teredinibacter purpureus]|uniref:tail fiber protein n=1 Tax=Teredinibacter purpureus TaxID=2731756 RepID=UPI000697F74A|nr:tail fiber protein [Teredinibacter purpureus]
MVDFSKPVLATPKVDVLSILNGKIRSVARMVFDSDSGVPDGCVRWSAANNRFEIWSEGGGSWGPLAVTYNINVSTFAGQSSSYYRNANNLNAGAVPLARLPNASTGAKGVVQLSSSTSSTSSTLAATPAAVKAVMDALGGKANSSHSHGVGDLPSASTSARGVVQLSSSTSSTSSTLAATPAAVKAVMDALGGKANSSHSHSVGDLPSASTSAKGAVQLSSSTSSTSTTQAATPSAVKSAYDLAASKANSSHSHSAGDLPSASTGAKGAVQLNSSTSSTSTSQAATPSAVKSAYDLAASKANSSHSHSTGDLPSASTGAKGVVQLSSSTGSTSSTLAATPAAVKAVNDALGVLAGTVGDIGSAVDAIAGGPVFKRKPESTPRASTTLTADPHLANYSMSAGFVWIDGLLRVAAGATGVRLQFSHSGNVGDSAMTYTALGMSSEVIDIEQVSATSVVTVTLNNSYSHVVLVKGWIYLAAAGDLQLRWAASSGATTTLSSGGYIAVSATG